MDEIKPAFLLYANLAAMAHVAVFSQIKSLTAFGPNVSADRLGRPDK